MFQISIGNIKRTFALISKYSPPDRFLSDKSYETVLACSYHGDTALALIEVEAIKAVVAMIPYQFRRDETLFFVVEKPGLDVATMGGEEQRDDNDGDRDL